METNENADGVYTLPKAAEACKREGLNLSYSQLRGLVASGRLKSFKNGRRFYVSMALLRAALKDPNSTLWDSIDGEN
ncbi:MAG: helix-turn-helix domain-containing protein [Chitinispirillales bacterium]|nr:helix-turn-helix domain-containing protein [Chitinispirillales bacterium]